MKDALEIKRKEMLVQQVLSRGVKDPEVIKSMGKVPRHRFVPVNETEGSYGDYPLPIGYGQTISQPYIVALMTELLGIDGSSRVLEIGTGSGYQTAVLAEIAKEVFTVELIPELYGKSFRMLEQMGYRNIQHKLGNGYDGWQENQLYDGIIVTAAPEEVPEALRSQLKDGGRLVVPVGGTFDQTLFLFRKQKGEFTEEKITGVRFVKLVGSPDKS